MIVARIIAAVLELGMWLDPGYLWKVESIEFDKGPHCFS